MRQATSVFYECAPNFTPDMSRQVVAETCRGKIWNTLIKSACSLTHLLVILQRYNTMLGPTINIVIYLFIQK
jgi:hypothetical protein